MTSAPECQCVQVRPGWQLTVVDLASPGGERVLARSVDVGLFGEAIVDVVIAVRPRPELGWRVDPASDPGRLVDWSGKLATFDGEIFRQACFDAASNTHDLGPEDLPDPDRPPN